MNAENLIKKVLKCNNAEEIFTKQNFKKEYISYMKILHPDICPLPKAHEAVTKINAFKKTLEQITRLCDDAGDFQWADATNEVLIFKGKKEILQKSFENYQKLMSLKDDASLHFQKYLPKKMEFQGDYLYVYLPKKSFSFSQLTLPQHHITWITSRMFELVAWLHQVGYCHAGLVPESLCVVPSTHGIVCVSFYHLTKIDTQIETISSKYLNWYPNSVFFDKRAIANLDLNLIQSTALYLLGDSSGNGVKLKKFCDETLINFLITAHYNAFEAFDLYRKMLVNVFGKPTYFPLEL